GGCGGQVHRRLSVRHEIHGSSPSSVLMTERTRKRARPNSDACFQIEKGSRGSENRLTNHAMRLIVDCSRRYVSPVFSRRWTVPQSSVCHSANSSATSF